MNKILPIFFLSCTTLLAMDGDEKVEKIKPKAHFSDSIEDAITDLIKEEELKQIQDRIEKRKLSEQKKANQKMWDTRAMLADIRRREIDFQLSDPDSLERLVAATNGLHVAKVQRKRPQTGFRSRFTGAK